MANVDTRTFSPNELHALRQQGVALVVSGTSHAIHSWGSAYIFFYFNHFMGYNECRIRKNANKYPFLALLYPKISARSLCDLNRARIFNIFYL